MNQGDLRLLSDTRSGKARPALIVTRDLAIPVLDAVTVAPVTTTIRRIPTCIPLGGEQGLSRDCVASFDNLDVIPKSMLVRRLGALGPGADSLICHALGAMADC